MQNIGLKKAQFTNAENVFIWFELRNLTWFAFAVQSVFKSQFQCHIKMFFALVYVCIMSAVWVSQCWTVCSCQEHDYVMLVPGLGWWHTYAGLGRWARAGHTTTASQQHNSNWPALSGPAISATTLSASSLGSSILAIPTFAVSLKGYPLTYLQYWEVSLKRMPLNTIYESAMQQKIAISFYMMLLKLLH